jgi:hypothetical protein
VRFFHVLACVLDCTCRDKPSWRGHLCVIGDNQQSRGVVIARNRSLGALDHQRRDLHSTKLSYVTEDRATSTITKDHLQPHGFTGIDKNLRLGTKGGGEPDCS